VQQVIYIEEGSPALDAWQALLLTGLRDFEGRVQFPDDKFQTKMGFENKAATGVMGSMLWASLLQLYEYMESSNFVDKREWRIVNPDPNYSIREITHAAIGQVSPPQGWAQHMNVGPVSPGDITKFICPRGEFREFQSALSAEYRNIPIYQIGGRFRSLIRSMF
jgi:hypothetical protein